MSELSLIVLTANSKDGAAKALDAAEALDRNGWIQLIDYSLASKDKNGHVTARELDDERSEKVAAVVVGAALGVATGTVGGPAAAAVGAATGAFAGVGSMKLMERIVLDAPPKGFPQSLEPDTSALAVIASAIAAYLCENREVAGKRGDEREVARAIAGYQEPHRGLPSQLGAVKWSTQSPNERRTDTAMLACAAPSTPPLQAGICARRHPFGRGLSQKHVAPAPLCRCRPTSRRHRLRVAA
jgi:uncharacterized membrane protein